MLRVLKMAAHLSRVLAMDAHLNSLNGGCSSQELLLFNGETYNSKKEPIEPCPWSITANSQFCNRTMLVCSRISVIVVQLFKLDRFTHVMTRAPQSAAPAASL